MENNYVELGRKAPVVDGRREGVENPFLVGMSQWRHIVDVDGVRVEDDGVAAVKLRPVAGQLALGARAAGLAERVLAQSEVEVGTAEVFVPEQDRFQFRFGPTDFLRFH